MLEDSSKIAKVDAQLSLKNFSLAKWMELMYNTNVRPRSIGLGTVN